MNGQALQARREQLERRMGIDAKAQRGLERRRAELAARMGDSPALRSARERAATYIPGFRARLEQAGHHVESVEVTLSGGLVASVRPAQPAEPLERPVRPARGHGFGALSAAALSGSTGGAQTGVSPGLASALETLRAVLARDSATTAAVVKAARDVAKAWSRIR